MAVLGVLALSACQTRLDTGFPGWTLDPAVESTLRRAGVMPGRVVSFSVRQGRFVLEYETEGEGRRYRMHGVLDQGTPVVETLCEVSGPTCIELLPEQLWDEGPIPSSV